MNLQNDIAKYIGALLYEYSTIIIPDLGMFSTHWKSATVDTSKGVITPPAKIVTFNERIKVNDGLMAGHISRVEKIPLNIAEEALKDWVAATNARLASGETIRLEGIGTLQRADGTTQFNLAENANFAVDTFGLSPVTIPTADTNIPNNATPIESRKWVVEDDIEEETLTGVANTHIPAPQTNTDANKKSISEVLSGGSEAAATSVTNTYNRPPQQRQNDSWWKWLLPLFLLFLIFFGIAQIGGETDRPWYNRKPFSFLFGDGTEQIANNNNETHQDPLLTPNDTTTNTVQEVDTVAQTIPVDTDTVVAQPIETPPPPKTEEAAKPTTHAANDDGGIEVIEGLKVKKSKTDEYVKSNDPKGFYVITGAFKSKTNAQKLVNTLRKDSQDVHLLETTSGFYRAGIYVKSGKISNVKTTFNKAQEKYNPDSWVLKYN